MEQKRVTFKVAKAIKEVGYPQDETEYKYTKEGNTFVPRNRGEDEKYSECDAPYVLPVWLWLWREKDVIIKITQCTSYVSIGNKLLSGVPKKDPEEAIAATIEYLVDNNLLK